MLKNYFFKNKKYLMLDGAMGTMLQNKGMKAGELPEILNITAPDVITDIHSEYIRAGADVIYANTFGANSHKLSGSGYTASEIIRAGIENAVNAAKMVSAASGRAAVALDVGPIGRMLRPTGSMYFDEAYGIFREIMIAGRDADIIVIETMSALLEAKAALLAAKENTDKPVFVTMTFEKNGRSFTGCTIASMAATLGGLGADAIGFNCSLGPGEMINFVKELSYFTDKPIVIKPNAGLPNPADNTYDISPEEFADGMIKMAEAGAVIFGGCCGTTPEFIKKTREKLDDWFLGNENMAVNIESNPKNSCDRIKAPVVCSQSRAFVPDRPGIIGERINPTGKKLFKEALQRHDINYILNRAIEQTEAGADILDVNVGLPGIDEKAMMVECIEAIQGIVPTPLQIDSANPEVLEAALRVYDGVPIINSVNGEDESLDTILPLAAKYGAPVIGLTLDGDGIPATVEKRIEIAEKIISRAKKYGISEEKIIIDCLTLTASAEQAGAMMTINAIEEIKKKYNVRTVLGISNISFGLPDRELINRTFLTMALTKGLDFAIINPNNAAIIETFAAYRVLAGIDKNSTEYIELKNIRVDEDADKSPVPAPDNGENIPDMLEKSIRKGLKDECKMMTELLLKENSPMDIVDKILIPALDATGVLFESGKIFLPQLIMSASAAGACLEVIKASLADAGTSRVNKGNVVLATVKGDIHDIGKNIVKALMENYGYNVIDLGRDVDPERVTEAILRHDAKLVGLSALMTTTLVSMENTIKLIREKAPDCRIVAGGAVLTKDYAMKIGADYYAKDAKQSVDVARIVYGN